MGKIDKKVDLFTYQSPVRTGREENIILDWKIFNIRPENVVLNSMIIRQDFSSG